MDQTQTVDNDLQKAIDDITNTTSIDPVFSDPVAAPSSIPEGDTGELAASVGPFPDPEPTPSIQPLNTPLASAPESSSLSDSDSAPALNMHQIKEAALRDLVPLIDRLNITPSQKFNLYRNVFENLKDYTIIEPAYHAATEIPDERERAEALLYLVDSIDKM